jgi:hypothetical protein
MKPRLFLVASWAQGYYLFRYFLPNWRGRANRKDRETRTELLTLYVTLRMPDGTPIYIGPFLGASPRGQRWHQRVGATRYFWTEKQNRSRPDCVNLFQQERAAGVLVLRLGFDQEAPGLLIATEGANEPIGTKALCRAASSLHEQRVEISRCSLQVSASVNVLSWGMRESLSTSSLRIQAGCGLPTRTCGIRRKLRR